MLALKTNQRTRYKQVQAALDQATLDEAALEEGHGHREQRRVQSYSVAALGLSAALVNLWPGLQSVVKVERVREVKNGQEAGQSRHSVWFYLSSLAPNEAALQHTIRAHWSIENQAHWVLDVVFGEDRCRARKDHAPYNLALLRRISLNHLRQNQGKNSLKATRKAVAWNQDLLCKTLHTPLALW